MVDSVVCSPVCLPADETRGTSVSQDTMRGAALPGKKKPKKQLLDVFRGSNV